MIDLQSELYEVVEIKKKTGAELFKNVKVGDRLRFSMEIEHTGRASGGGVFASSVYILNVTQDRGAWKTQSQLVNILKNNFEIKQVQ